MREDARWITEADVVRLIDLPAGIQALEEGLRREAAGEAVPMAKTQLLWDGHSTLHALGAACAADGLVGVKTWAHTEGGATPLVLLWDAATGALRAVIEAFALGQLRTASMSGLATRWLSDPSLDVAALIGTGHQAAPQAAALLSVRQPRVLRVFGRDAARRETFVAKLRALGAPARIEAAASVEACVAGAGVVTLATRAREPFLAADMLAPGTHVNAIGAVGVERAEFRQDLFDRAAVVACDSLEGTRRQSREFRDRFGTGSEGWETVRRIADIVAAGAPPPRPGDRITLFKAMGTGLADLALATAVLRTAQAQAVGRAIPPVRRVEPVLFPASVAA
jgi:ornithine cyclodeaminase